MNKILGFFLIFSQVFISTSMAEEKGLSKEQISQTIKSHLRQVLECYDNRLKIRPEIAGTVSVKFEIDPSGIVSSSTIHKSTLQDTETETCITEKAKTWIFPVPAGGTKVVVFYPFNFKKTK